MAVESRKRAMDMVANGWDWIPRKSRCSASGRGGAALPVGAVVGGAKDGAFGAGGPGDSVPRAWMPRRVGGSVMPWSPFHRPGSPTSQSLFAPRKVSRHVFPSRPVDSGTPYPPVPPDRARCWLFRHLVRGPKAPRTQFPRTLATAVDRVALCRVWANGSEKLNSAMGARCGQRECNRMGPSAE